MPRVSANHITALLKKSVNPLRGAEKDYDPLMDLIGEARVVLLGEASHGTREFYRKRRSSPTGSSRKKGLRGSPSKLIGRMRTA